MGTSSRLFPAPPCETDPCPVPGFLPGPRIPAGPRIPVQSQDPCQVPRIPARSQDPCPVPGSLLNPRRQDQLTGWKARNSSPDLPFLIPGAWVQATLPSEPPQHGPPLFPRTSWPGSQWACTSPTQKTSPAQPRQELCGLPAPTPSFF